jgi:cell division protein FtsQ
VIRKAKKVGAQAQPNPAVVDVRRRHPLLIAAGAVGFFMFVCGGYLTQKLFDPVAFPISKIEVEGEFRQLTSEHVQALVSNAIHGGFFGVDVGNVRTRILHDPWIFDASVRRVWPATIRVSIREQAAVARWGEYGLLNRVADIFVPEANEMPRALTVLNGPIGSEEEMLARFLAVQKLLDTIGLRAAKIGLSERGAWEVEIIEGATLIRGRYEIDQRLSLFNQAFERQLKENWTHVDLVDLRYTNGFAIREKLAGADNG